MTERPEPGPAQPAARGGAVPSGALEGLVVVSIAQNLPGPVAAARLQGLGARVVTIQPPSGDPLRHQLPELFEHLHRGQEVLSLDLKSDEGRERLEGLLEGADLLLSSSRAGALRRLGLDFASVHPRHPGLCQVDLVGFPGDHADRPGHDLSFQAGAGLLDPDRLPRTLSADMHGAEQAVSAALTLLLSRERHGTRGPDGRWASGGGHEQMALSEAALDLALPVRWGMTGPESPLGGASPYYRIYPAAQGHVALAALEPHFVQALVGLGLDPQGDVPEQLTWILAERTAQEWEDWAARAGAPLTALAEPVRPGPSPDRPESGAP